MNKILLSVILIISTSVFAAPPILVDRATGKYLGTLSSNQYDPDSTSNPYGQYGSKHSADSINNPYGEHGSPYSDKSPNNQYATNAPVILQQNNY